MLSNKKRLSGIKSPIITLDEFMNTSSATLCLTNHKQIAAAAREFNRHGIYEWGTTPFQTLDMRYYYTTPWALENVDGTLHPQLLIDSEKNAIKNFARTGIPPSQDTPYYLFQHIDFGLNGHLISAKHFFDLPPYAIIHARGTQEVHTLLQSFAALGHTWAGGEPLNENLKNYDVYGDFYFYNSGEYSPRVMPWHHKVAKRNCTYFEFADVDFTPAQIQPHISWQDFFNLPHPSAVECNRDQLETLLALYYKQKIHVSSPAQDFLMFSNGKWHCNYPCPDATNAHTASRYFHYDNILIPEADKLKHKFGISLEEKSL